MRCNAFNNRLNNWDSFFVLLCFCSLPVPFFVGARGLVTDDPGTGGTAVLPLSFIMCFLYLAMRLMHGHFKKSALCFCFIFGCFSYIPTMLFSTVASPFYDLTTLYFANCVLGLCLGVDLCMLNKNPVKILGIAAFCVALLFIVLSFCEFGFLQTFTVRGVDTILGMYIHQKLVAFPTVLAIGFGAVLFEECIIWKKIVMATVIAVALVILSSRESIVLAFLFLTLKNYRYALGIGMLLTVLLVHIGGLEGITLINKIASLRDVSIGGYTGGRDDIAIDALQLLAQKNPFVWFSGGGFTDYIYDMRSGTPHNQYVELIMAVGVIGCFVFLLMVLISTFRYKKRVGVTYPLIVVLSMLAVSFNINTPMRVPLTSIVFFIFLGIVLQCRDLGPSIDKSR